MKIDGVTRICSFGDFDDVAFKVVWDHLHNYFTYLHEYAVPFSRADWFMNNLKAPGVKAAVWRWVQVLRETRIAGADVKVAYPEGAGSPFGLFLASKGVNLTASVGEDTSPGDVKLCRDKLDLQRLIIFEGESGDAGNYDIVLLDRKFTERTKRSLSRWCSLLGEGGHVDCALEVEVPEGFNGDFKGFWDSRCESLGVGRSTFLASHGKPVVFGDPETAHCYFHFKVVSDG